MKGGNPLPLSKIVITIDNKDFKLNPRDYEDNIEKYYKSKQKLIK